MTHPTIELAKELISRESITPEDAGCQELMIRRLQRLGFRIERLHFEDTINFWARRGSENPVLGFAGHTDVVPPGDEALWDTSPFEPTIIGDMLYGRGAADMKGSLAAIVVAVERFVAANPNHKGSIALLITSDEEGPFVNGTVRVIEHLEQRDEKMTWCVVGEPSSTDHVGDVVKNGRRGSLTGDLKVKGIQGHVAYPHLADNPVHKAAPLLTELSSTEWDQGNDFFPPTSFQIANIHAGTGASNVVPGHLDVMFNFRFSTESTTQGLVQRVESLIDTYGFEYELNWTYNGEPFLTDTGILLEAVCDAIEKVNGQQPQLLTTGGTSDGRFIAPTGAQVIELGPCNATIHKVNESVSCNDLILLTDMYEGIMEYLLK